MSDVPQVQDILTDVWRRTGWSASEFDLYRIRVQYPVLGLVVKMQFHSPADPWNNVTVHVLQSWPCFVRYLVHGRAVD